MTWTARTRTPTLTLSDPLEFSKATFVENYNQPDMLSLEGSRDKLRPALRPDHGVVLTDHSGAIRFSGYSYDLYRIGKGNRAELVVYGDLSELWTRWCYPTPANPWQTGTGGQTSAYDVQTGPVETRFLGYISRNCGPSARP